MNPDHGDPHTEQKEGGGYTYLDVALLLADHVRLLVGLPFAAGVVALLISFALPPTFTAAARILPPGQQQSTTAALAAQLGVLAGLVGGSASLKNPADQYAALLKSRTVFDRIVQRFNLAELYNERYIEDARKKLEDRTNISVGAKDGIITIEVDDHDPKRAADMANAFVDELKNLTNTLAVTEAGQRRLFFEAQLKQAKDNLTAAETSLQESGISEAALKSIPQSAIEAIARLKAQITGQEIKISVMRTSMTESNAELRVALQELAALRKELSKVEQASNGGGRQEGGEYIAKYRNYKYQETLYELIAKQYELARLDEVREGAVIQVVDRAIPPQRKSKPKKALIASLTMVSVFFALAIGLFSQVAFREALAEPGSQEKLKRLRSLLRIRRAK